MTGRSAKRKGTTGERDAVNQAKAAGIPAERAYASNGRALGHTEPVDAIIGPYRTQIKRRAKIATYITPPQGTDMTLIREDHGQWLAVIPYDTLLQLLKGGK